MWLSCRMFLLWNWYTYHADEFRDGVYTSVEGAILVFEFVELVYINEYGNEFKTSIIKD